MRLQKGYTKFSLMMCGIAAIAFAFGVFLNLTPMAFASDSSEQDSTTSHFVTFYDEGHKLTVKTSAITVGEALSRANISILETDIVEPALTELITDTTYINIHRSRPVIIEDGQTKKYVMTASYDPETIVTNAGLSIYDGDEISFTENTNFLEAGSATTYKITRNGGETITIESAIKYEEETVEDENLMAGERKITQEGEDGRKVTKYAIHFVDGVEVSRTLISEEVTKEPVKKITAVGSKQAANIPVEWEECASWARSAGVPESDLHTALTLIYHESGCRTNATNPSSGAYGIPQSLPGRKMATMGDDWETNPITQIKWMINYVNTRYGGWSNALDFWWCTGECRGIQKNGHWY